MDAFGARKYLLPPLLFPLALLKLLLMLMRRNNINPRCNFDSTKLHKLGFKSPVSLKEGLTEYAAWYRTMHIDGKETIVS